MHGDAAWQALPRCSSATTSHTLVVIGGDGTLERRSGSSRTAPAHRGAKTIDNDINGTDFTLRLRHCRKQSSPTTSTVATTTAEAHNRVTWWRSWVARRYGSRRRWLAGGAGNPESRRFPTTSTRSWPYRRRHRRQNYSVVVIAEGVEPPQGRALQRMPSGFDPVAAWRISSRPSSSSSPVTRRGDGAESPPSGVDTEPCRPGAGHRPAPSRRSVARRPARYHGRHARRGLVPVRPPRAVPRSAARPASYEVAETFFGRVDDGRSTTGERSEARRTRSRADSPRSPSTAAQPIPATPPGSAPGDSTISDSTWARSSAVGSQ